MLAFLLGGCMGKSKPKFTEEELGRIPLVKKTGPVAASGRHALVVNNDFVTVNEIVTASSDELKQLARKSDFKQFESQAKPLVEGFIKQKIADILLYEEAEKHIHRYNDDIDEVLDKIIEAEVAKFVAGFDGDYARAEAELKKMGTDWAGFREDKKKLILIQSYLSERFDETEPVTYSELLDYYNDIKQTDYVVKGYVKFRLIDIQPGQLPDGLGISQKMRNGVPVDSNQAPVTDNLTRARKLAAELLQKIKAGEDFGRLAREYSHGHRGAFDGLWSRVAPDSLARPYNVLENPANKLDVGEVAGPIETQEKDHIFIMKLEERQADGFEPFEKVQSEVEAKLRRKRRMQAIDKFITKLMRQAWISNIEEFANLCVLEIYKQANGQKGVPFRKQYEMGSQLNIE